MYAVIGNGGKQYRLCEGDVLELERLAGDVGDQVALENVLYIGDEENVTVGEPLVEDARVLGTILDQDRGEKVIVFKFKRRKMYRRKRGHRQQLTRVRVDSIEIGPGKAVKESNHPAEEVPKAAGPEKKAPKKTATKSRKAPRKVREEQATEEQD